MNTTVGCGSLRALVKMSYNRARARSAHLAERAGQLFVQRPQAQCTDMARPVVAVRDGVILDRFGTYPAQIRLILTGVVVVIGLNIRLRLCGGIFCVLGKGIKFCFFSVWRGCCGGVWCIASR